jgi:hypothetical protein
MQSVDLINGASSENDCSHYWVIESPSGPTSEGWCKACGEVREFKNSIQITSWESDGNQVNRTQT